MKTYTFRKEERLKSKILIGKLFTEGKSFLSYPLKVVFTKTTLNCHYPAQVSISVSKRNFKKAVDRNTIKRKIKEAYRLNKHELYEIIDGHNCQIALMIIYIGKEIPDYPAIEKAIKKSFPKISSKI